MYYVIPDVFKDGIRSCSPGPIVMGKYYFVLDSRDLVVEKIDGSAINAYYFDLKSEFINVWVQSHIYDNSIFHIMWFKGLYGTYKLVRKLLLSR